MNDSCFYSLWDAALKTADREEYVSEWVLSSIWGDPEGANIPEERIKTLSDLWDTANASIRDIRACTGLKRTDFAARYLIPYRTIENWERGDNQCPDYVRLLLALATGFYHRPAAGAPSGNGG
nr:MAG TPA: antitoxin [Caudoviricetes sp.]